MLLLFSFIISDVTHLRIINTMDLKNESFISNDNKLVISYYKLKIIKDGKYDIFDV